MLKFLVNLEDLQPGDHLAAPRRWYTHHGIYLGDSKVIHYCDISSTNIPAGKIIISNFEYFKQNKPVYRVLHLNSKYNPVEVVKRAKSRLNEFNYSLVTNNCEHFVNWVIDGKSYSLQVHQVKVMAEIGKTTIDVITELWDNRPTKPRRVKWVSLS